VIAVGEALVGAGDVARLQPILDAMPGLREYGFECRLGQLGSSVDFACSLGVPPSVEARRWIRGWPTWGRYADCGEGAREMLGSAWAEFDVDGDLAEPAGIFLCLRRSVGLERVDRLLHEALGWTAPPALAETLRAVAAALPDAHLGGVGCLAARAVPGVRLLLRGPRIPAGLSSLGVVGAADRLQEVLDVLGDWPDEYLLALDVMDGVGQRVGYEAYLHHPLFIAARWRALIASLAATGLCTAEKAAALREFPRFDTPSAVARISHVKVTSRPAGGLEARAYLCFTSLQSSPSPADSLC
jgi:hypothetical protein